MHCSRKAAHGTARAFVETRYAPVAHAPALSGHTHFCGTAGCPPAVACSYRRHSFRQYNTAMNEGVFDPQPVTLENTWVRLEPLVPAHGPAMDKRIIDANERYVGGVYEAVAAAKAAGAGRGELDLPAERFLSAGVIVDYVYAAAHRENLRCAWDEV